MRLDRYLAECQGCTRKEAATLIKQGVISVNSTIAVKAALHVSESDVVKYNNEDLSLPQPLYWMMHKPGGVVCSAEDSSHPVVFDLLDWSKIPKKLHPNIQIVGRLDCDTTGLLFLTTDGAWNQALRSPKNKIAKTYQVGLADPIDETDIARLEAGITLKSDDKPTLPCKIDWIKHPSTVKIVLHEGRYHQIKRMFAAVGNKVISLHRHSIGPVTLDPTLNPGQYRPLLTSELEGLSLKHTAA